MKCKLSVPATSETKPNQSHGSFPSCRQSEGNIWLSRFLTHLSLRNQHVRLQRKPLLVLVSLTINTSFLPLSTQRDRDLTNVLRPCVIRCLRSEAASFQEVQRIEQVTRDWTWNSSLSILHLSQREELLSKSGTRVLEWLQWRTAVCLPEVWAEAAS